MRVFNQAGDTVNITVGGRYSDDIQINSAEFEMHPELDVPDTDIEWILENHADEIYQEWLENRIDEAELACELRRDAEMGL